MTANDFDMVLKERLEAAERVLGSKAKEYASQEDRLHNFKRAAALLGQTPAQACVGFMTKHLVSILDIVTADAKGLKVPIEVREEKIGDAINYLILLDAILRDDP